MINSFASGQMENLGICSSYKWGRIQTSTACSFALIQALEPGWKTEGHKLPWNVWGLFPLMWYIFKLEVLASGPEGSSHVQNYFIYYIFYHLQNTCIVDKQRNSRAASLMSNISNSCCAIFLWRTRMWEAGCAMAKSSSPNSPLKCNEKTRRLRSYSQKRWVLQMKELDENGVCPMNFLGSCERCIFHLSGLIYPKHFTFLRTLVLLK